MRLLAIMIVFLPLTGLAAQVLPDDLKAAVEMEQAGDSSDTLLQKMMRHREVQEGELKALQDQHGELLDKLGTVDKRIKTNKLLSWILMPLGIAAVGTAGYFAYKSIDAHSQYQSSQFSADLVQYRRDFETYSTVMYAVGGSGLGLFGAGGIIALSRPDKEQLVEEEEILSQKIRFLEGLL